MARPLTALTTVLVVAIAAHSLDKPALGVVSVLATIATYLGFGDFGLGTLIMTRLPVANARSDTAEMRFIVTVSLLALCTIGGAIAALGSLSAFLLPWQSLLGAHRLPQHEVRLAVVSFFVTGGISIPGTIAGRILAALQRSSVAYWWTTAGGLLSLVMTAGCAADHAPLWLYVVAVAGAPALVSIVQTAWLLSAPFPQLRPRLDGVTLSAAWAFLRTGSLYAVFNVASVIAYGLDFIVVSSILGAGAAAVFAVAARMFSLVGSTLALAGQQMWPALADAVTRGEIAWVRSRYRRVLMISTSVNLGGCLLLVAVGRPISRIWVGHALAPPLGLLVALAIWTVVSTAVNQAAYLLTATGRIKVLAIAAALLAPINLVLSIALTHDYGLSGPILGSIAALMLTLLVPVIVLSRKILRGLEQPA